VSRRVYLAGPMVFAPDPAALFARMKAICAAAGLEGVAPVDNQAGLEGLPPGRGLLRRIVAADIALMQAVDGALFCLDGFRRGPEMDPGTAFEIGYVAALGKPMAGWTSDPREYPVRVRDYFAEVFGKGLVPAAPNADGGTSGALRDPDGVLVHSEGCVQNAMCEIGIERSGGAVFGDPDWTRAFAQAVRDLAGRLGAA
jgi:nucleoside 2-deoxyribosyltransferase